MVSWLGGGGGYLESVVRPATEFQHARLLVEREKFHVDLARRFEYGRRFPFYQPYVVYGRLGGQRHVKIPVGAADHTQIHTNCNITVVSWTIACYIPLLSCTYKLI